MMIRPAFLLENATGDRAVFSGLGNQRTADRGGGRAVWRTKPIKLRTPCIMALRHRRSRHCLRIGGVVAVTAMRC